MKIDSSPKPQSHLINILRNTRDHHPNFALLLGAGASKTSGVRLASEMITDWRSDYFKTFGKGTSQAKFWRDQYWHQQPEEYSVLFEALYDHPSQRREVIESCVAKASPSWGYIYLVNLLKQRVFNTVFTTNFDDLLNEACYLFSDNVRPIVCAHDSSIRSVRLSSPRPKIIKLHGDFLFDNIKNTMAELETLEANIKEKFKQYATEFGLIVVGYAGNDRSIMDTLGTLLKTETSFPHGVYWCAMKGAELCPYVDQLTRFSKFKLIEIDGFDHLFADIQEGLGLELQPEMLNPYGSLTRRLNGLIENVRMPEGKTHHVIERDIRAIGRQLSPSQDVAWDASKIDALTIKVGDRLLKMSLPYELLAQIEERQSHHKQAIDYMVRALKETPSPRAFLRAFELCRTGGCHDRLDELVRLLLDAKDVLVEDPTAPNAVALTLMHVGKYDLAEQALDFGMELMQRAGKTSQIQDDIFFLNKAQIKVHQNIPLSDSEKIRLEELSKVSDPLIKMGAMILLGQYDEAEQLIGQVVEEKRSSRTEIESWPITTLLRKHRPLVDKLIIEGGSVEGVS